MINVLLTILLSVSVAAILKITELKHVNRMVMIGTNYIVATIILAVILVLKQNFLFSRNTLLLGLAGGITFPLGFYLITRAIGEMGISVSVSIMRLSVVIPTFGSIFVWSEIPNTYQDFGIALTLIAIVLLSNFSFIRDKRSAHWILAVSVFFVLGFNDFLMKIFDSLQPLSEKNPFMFVLFGFSGVMSWLFILQQKIPVHPPEIGWGSLLGIPNLFTTFFFILALTQLPGVEVFPMVNIGIISLSLLLGTFIWHEKLSPREWTGFFLALIAVTLLNMK